MFRYYVKDKTGHIEMEIFSEDTAWYRIHFPRFEFSTGNQPLRMRLTDVLALLFAYNENEYKKFKKKVEGLYVLSRRYEIKKGDTVVLKNNRKAEKE